MTYTFLYFGLRSIDIIKTCKINSTFNIKKFKTTRSGNLHYEKDKDPERKGKYKVDTVYSKSGPNK